jgi:hypothetical protein
MSFGAGGGDIRGTTLQAVTEQEWTQDMLNAFLDPPDIATFVKLEPVAETQDEPVAETPAIVPARKRQRKAATATTVSATTSKATTAASAKPEPVAPPRQPKSEVQSTTLTTAEETEGDVELHLVFKHANVIGFLFAGMKRVCEHFPLKFTKTGLLIRFFDSVQVALYEIWIPAKEACLVYEVPLRDFRVSLPVLPFKTRRDQFVEKKTMTFTMQCTGPRSNELMIKLFPSTGNRSEGMVSTFPMTVSKDAGEPIDDYEPDDVFQHEITVSRELLCAVLKMLDKVENISFTLTAEQVIVTGNIQATKRQERHEIPIGKPADGMTSIEYVMKPKSERCVVKHVTPKTPREPITDLCISALYFSNSIYAAEKAGYFKIRVGRMPDGRFSPLCLKAFLPDGCTFVTYIGTVIGDEEEQALYTKAIETERQKKEDAKRAAAKK